MIQKQTHTHELDLSGLSSKYRRFLMSEVFAAGCAELGELTKRRIRQDEYDTGAPINGFVVRVPGVGLVITPEWIESDLTEYRTFEDDGIHYPEGCYHPGQLGKPASDEHQDFKLKLAQMREVRYVYRKPAKPRFIDVSDVHRAKWHSANRAIHRKHDFGRRCLRAALDQKKIELCGYTYTAVRIPGTSVWVLAEREHYSADTTSKPRWTVAEKSFLED